MTRSDYHVTYQRTRRERARAAGLCGQCCKRTARVGKFRCSVCADMYTTGQPYSCSVCLEAGHDKRTCPKRAPDASKEFCVECIASGFHRAGCSLRERAA